MKQKILFVCNNLNHGGIPRALVNLLQEIAGSCEIDLLLFYPSGSYLTPGAGIRPDSARRGSSAAAGDSAGRSAENVEAAGAAAGHFGGHEPPAWEFFGPEDCICFCAGAVRI